MSDETWSRPTLLLRKEQMDIIARARPPLLEHKFNETQRPKTFALLGPFGSLDRSSFHEMFLILSVFGT